MWREVQDMWKEGWVERCIMLALLAAFLLIPLQLYLESEEIKKWEGWVCIRSHTEMRSSNLLQYAGNTPIFIPQIYAVKVCDEHVKKQSPAPS